MGYSQSSFSKNALAFLTRLASDTGLDAGVIAAWMIAEEPVGGDVNPGTGNQNWLNIGYFDSGPGQIAFSQTFADPQSAADYTTKFLQGTWGGASSGIQAILGTAGQSPQAQIAAIQKSGWASSGYPDLPKDYASLDKSFVSWLGGQVPKGGIAGLGGTGTPSSTYTFQVGSTDNPDEDNWTAANRLAQEVNWYLFSDAETVYFIDGADLIAQDPGENALIDRVRDRARIVRLEATYDNTAYQFASTHKRKKRVQHKTRLQMVTSPTQVELDLICGVDEFRAGDLIVLSSCGPLDGRWIIGDCRRSVFQVYSQMRLVPPIMPLAESQAAGTTGAKGAADPGSTGKPTGSWKGLVSPFIKRYSAGRTDMGVDFNEQHGIRPGDPILAIGDCYLRRVDPNWYAGQPCMFFEFADKSNGYWGWYVGEQIDMKVAVSGQLIKASTVVARFAQSGTGIEIGLAGSATQTLAQATTGYHEGDVTQAGSIFLGFLQKAGAV